MNKLLPIGVLVVAVVAVYLWMSEAPRQAPQQQVMDTPALREALRVASSTLADPRDAAAVMALNNGTLLLEHHPDALARRRVLPGSVAKIFSSVALVQAGRDTTRYRCLGKHVDRLGIERPCWNRAGHHEMHLRTAIAMSCNVWFYENTQHLHPEQLLRAFSQFGIGAPWDSDIHNISRDLVPSTINDRDLPDVAVGDHLSFAMSPMSLLRAVSLIATRGRLVTPSRQGTGSITSPAIHVPTLEMIAEGMDEVVQSGTLASVLGKYDVAAKTGTAKKREALGTRGLVVGYAPARQPRYAFVVVKNEGRGAVDAGPAAQALVEALTSAGALGARN